KPKAADLALKCLAYPKLQTGLTFLGGHGGYSLLVDHRPDGGVLRLEQLTQGDCALRVSWRVVHDAVRQLMKRHRRLRQMRRQMLVLEELQDRLRRLEFFSLDGLVSH